MEKHFVQFFSPGTFVSEQSEFEVSTFDKVQAVEKAREIVERHGARPYGFRFVTKTRGEDDLDSHVSYYSGMHYLGGSIYSLAEIKARNDPKDSILISNMEMNGIARVIENNNSWRFTGEFKDGDQLLSVEL